MSTTTTSLLARLPRPQRSTVVWGMVLVNVEVLYLATYLAVTGRSLFDRLAFVLFPFVWINVGLWAIVRADPPPASSRWRRTSAALAVGYFLVLAYVAGMVAPGEAFGGNPAVGFEAILYRVPPGWAPGLVYNGSLVHVSLLPPYVVGLAALTTLVYVRILEASRLASVGVVGLFSCVSCTFPLLVAIVAGAAGVSSSALLAAIAPVAYELGMVAFVVTVAVLSWQPTIGGAGLGSGGPSDDAGPGSGGSPDDADLESDGPE